MGNNIAPQIGRSGIAMKKQDRVPGTFLYIVDLRAVDLYVS
jgi:hypothetical protein